MCVSVCRYPDSMTTSGTVKISPFHHFTGTNTTIDSLSTHPAASFPPRLSLRTQRGLKQRLSLSTSTPSRNKGTLYWCNNPATHLVV